MTYIRSFPITTAAALDIAVNDFINNLPATDQILSFHLGAAVASLVIYRP